MFWSKGRGALLLQRGSPDSTCVEVAADPGGLPEVYASTTRMLSLRYPSGFIVSDTYRYQLLGPGKEIAGVRFIIDPRMATGTNLSSDTYVSVEQLPGAVDCLATNFLMPGAASTTVVDSGTTYSYATTSDAAAGNRYEESVYAIPGSSPCTAVRYFVHYSVFENYPAGTVVQFDHAALLRTFDAIRQTLVY